MVDTSAAEQRVGDLVEEVMNLTHSRISGTEGGDTDRVIGLVHRLEILETAAAGQKGKRLRELLDPGAILVT